MKINRNEMMAMMMRMPMYMCMRCCAVPSMSFHHNGLPQYKRTGRMKRELIAGSRFSYILSQSERRNR